MFSFSLISGNAATVLDAPEKLVVTESTAKKYFGTENPIGKTLKVGGTKNFLVTGVCKDAPGNSQIQFEFVGSFTTLNASKEEKWNEANYATYLLLNDKTSVKDLQPKITALKKVGKEEMKWREKLHDFHARATDKRFIFILRSMALNRTAISYTYMCWGQLLFLFY